MAFLRLAHVLLCGVLLLSGATADERLPAAYSRQMHGRNQYWTTTKAITTSIPSETTSTVGEGTSTVGEGTSTVGEGTSTPPDVTSTPPDSTSTTAVTTVDGSSTATTATTGQTTDPNDVCEGLGNLVRREFHQLSEQEWADYVEAFNLLTNKSSVTRPGLSVYEQFTADHDVFAEHSNPLFLPWHRLMLWEWDKALNAVKPGVVQPYFDWSVSSDNIFADALFGVNRFGNSVATDGNSEAPIPNGPWRGLFSDWTSPHLVARNFASFPLPDRQFVDDLVGGVASFVPFSTALEHEHHDLFHGAIGGDMGSLATSPNSPLFYAHHAYVDSIYTRWQATNGNTAVQLGAELRPWGKTTRQVLEGISGCVTYEGVGPQSATTSGSPSADSADPGAANAALFGSVEDKRTAQEAVAEKKKADPQGYKDDLIRWKEEQAGSAFSSQLLGADPGRVAAAKVTAEVLLLKRGLDLKETDGIESKPVAEIASEGNAEAQALASNEPPPGKESLADVANMNTVSNTSRFS